MIQTFSLSSLFRKKYSDCAKKIRDDHIRGYVNVVAPAYAFLEFSNTLRKYVNRGILLQPRQP